MKRMKLNSRKFGIVFFLCIWMLASITVNASGKNVTKTMKRNSNFTKICKMFGNYTDCYLAEHKNKKKVVHKLSAKNELDISAYIAYKCGGTSRFTEKSIHKWTYNLFGTKPSVKSIPSEGSSKAKWIVKTTDSNYPYRYYGGDWGDYKPQVTIKKVVKYSKYYVVTLDNKLGSWESSTVKSLGTTKLVVTPNSKSSYKYKITKIVTQGNGKGYF